MPRHRAEAPNFRDKGRVKEFITEDGRTYLILRFPDGSIAVLQKIKGTKEASADYKGVGGQKAVLKKLGCRAGSTYQMGGELFK